jgi:hypothetical protein
MAKCIRIGDFNLAVKPYVRSGSRTGVCLPLTLIEEEGSMTTASASSVNHNSAVMDLDILTSTC